MDPIEADELYEERGSVSFSRPILQGDIFEGVVIPGFSDDQRRVQIVTHPCSMRHGTVVNQRIQVAPVEPYQKVPDWQQHGRVMPLPDLHGDGQWHAARFVELTSVEASKLKLEFRVASLSHPGIHVLQQRLVYFHTRLDLGLSNFRAQSAPTLAEAEMQELWSQTVLGDNAGVEEVLTEAQAFQDWLSQEGDHRRSELASEANHARLRRETRSAAIERRTAKER